jgi:hypothetical protein
VTDDDVLAAMERYGGSFIYALAQCFRRADEDNRYVLRAAFPTYWAQYAELATRCHCQIDAHDFSCPIHNPEQG